LPLLFLLAAAVNGQLPVANFTGSPISGCPPMVVNFQDLSTGNPTSWAWDFGNGSTSSLQNPTATYFDPGTYTVTLAVTNANGTNTLVRANYVVVHSLPTVNFIADDSTGCFPLPVQFTDLSTGGPGNTIAAWEWDFGDGASSTQQNPSHTYVTSGNFTVTLKVTNDKGCIRIFSKPLYIQVTPGVVASFTNSSVNSCAPPVTITFTNTSTGPGVLTYLWDFGDGGNSTAQNPVHVYNNPGSFPVTLTVTSDQGCQTTVVHNPGVAIDTIITDFSAPDTVCQNSLVTFTNLSSPAAVATFWDFGDATTSTATNPTKVYPVPGVYQVKLRSTHSFCADSIIKPIVVLASPVADFEAIDTVRCQPPLTTNFTDLSTGGVTSWLWDFGDGNTSTAQNPSNTYTFYSDFHVSLIVRNDFGCADTILKPAYVKIRRPVITIAGLPTEGCVPHTINPIPTVVTFGTVTSWAWDFGDGNTSTLQNPSNTYVTQGTYTVSLTITTSEGCTETLTIANAVRVGTDPAVDFSANPLISCVKQDIQFTDLSVPVDRWLWDFGDGATSSTQHPIHQYTDTGFYTIKLVAWNNGCPDSLTRSAYIQILPPVARFGILFNCLSRNVFTFVDQSVLPLTWAWNFGDGNTSGVQNPPPHTYGALGAYNVTLVVTNGGCTDSTTQTVNVINENPDFTGVPATICRRDTVTFTAINIVPANVLSYEWDFGDGVQVSTAVPVIRHAYPNSGNYTVRLITIDLNNCRDTIIKNNYIRVNGPDADFSVTNNSGCVGLTATFTDLSTTDGVNAIVSWQWNFGDGVIQTFAGPPFTHTYNTEGLFNVTLLVTDASGCSDSIRYNSLVRTTDPLVSFFTNDTLTCPGAIINWGVTMIGNIGNFIWNFGDGTTSTQVFPPKSYAAPGVYTVSLTIQDVYGCFDSMVRVNYIRVDEPIANFQMDDSMSSCIPFEVNFTNTSTYYNTQLWNFDDGGTSNLQNPTHYFTSPGVYDVQLIITSPGGCQDTITKVVTLYDTAGTRLSYLPVGGCKPLTVAFNIVTPSPATFLWDFGDGQTFSSVGPDTVYTYTTFGNFVPKVILQDPSGCLIPVPGFDTIRVVGAAADFGQDDSVFCDNGLVNFSDSSTFNDPIVSYSWDFGDGGTSTLQNPSHFYAAPGWYNVSLAIETQLGCVDTIRKDSLIKIIARPDITIDGDTAACVNAPLNIFGTFLTPDTSVVTWSWIFGNGNTSTLQNPPPQTYTSSGNLMITAYATNSSGCRDTATQPIRIHPLPSVTMPPELTIPAGTSIQIPTSYSGTMNSFSWTPTNFLNCTTCPSPVAGPPANTVYTVTFADSNNCENTGSILIRVVCQNSNVFMPNTFSPNGDGANDVLYPRGTGLDRVRVLRVFNRWGEVVFERNDFPVNNAASGWDGTSKGKKANPDVYVYQLEVFCSNGELLKFSGNVALIK
jgi:gliding motility-associated-like protein